MPWTREDKDLYNKRYYQENKEVINKRHKEKKLQVRDWYVNFKRKQICNRCGFSDYRALEFHHIDRKEKFIDVSRMVYQGYTIENIIKEIEKCEIICSNCHQIEGYEQQGRLSKLKPKKERNNPCYAVQ